MSISLSLSFLNIHIYALTHMHETNDAWSICMNMIWERRCEGVKKAVWHDGKKRWGRVKGQPLHQEESFMVYKSGEKGGKKRKKNFFFIPVALIIQWEFHIPTTFFHMSRANLLHTCSSFKLNWMNTQACS